MPWYMILIIIPVFILKSYMSQILVFILKSYMSQQYPSFLSSAL